jgi:alkylated DNA repair dioxygenase AlkB
MVQDSPIASISIGLKMRFRVRTISDHTILFDDYLESGSCLIMEKQMQKLTEHCVWGFSKKELEIIDPDEIRVNLTFRMMISNT